MSSITEFIRRHRGKIIVGSVVAGGAYFAQKYLRQYYERARSDENLAAAATAAFGMDPQRMMLQNRRFYIFDSNQRTCDNSILQIVPSIKTKLQKRFDVETAADNLKKQTSETDGNLNKFESWNQMKTDAFARLLSASIAFTILILSLKTQISILAAQIYQNSIESTPSKYESWISRAYYALGGRMAGVKPRTGVAKPNLDVDKLKNSSAVQQLFLQALQYFVNKGVDSLADSIHSTVSEELSTLSLKEPLTYDQLKILLHDLRSKVISPEPGARHFSFYVVPLCHTGTLQDDPILEELLILLKTVLESPDAQQIFDYGMDLFTDGALKFIVNAVPEYQGENYQKLRPSEKPSSFSNVGVPLARLIPVLTDAFHDVSRVNFDSVLSNFIISEELQQFCVKVFEKDQSIW